jgi:hypothetical protein
MIRQSTRLTKKTELIYKTDTSSYRKSKKLSGLNLVSEFQNSHPGNPQDENKLKLLVWIVVKSQSQKPCTQQ